MKTSLVLSIIGGTFGILVALAVFVFGIFVTTMEEYGWTEVGSGVELHTRAGVIMLGSIIGIVGGVIGRKIGGILLIASAVITLFADGIFVIPSSALFAIAGVIAFREKKEVKSEA